MLTFEAVGVNEIALGKSNMKIEELPRHKASNKYKERGSLRKNSREHHGRQRRRVDNWTVWDPGPHLPDS